MARRLERFWRSKVDYVMIFYANLDMSKQIDVAVIGGGLVGLATAYRLLECDPEYRVVILEKESSVGRHQSGRNSGVIHSGIYYPPGSLKARNCRAGKVAMEAFCRENGIAYERCGKVIVATRSKELPILEEILRRGRANGVECDRIGPERLREIEPHAEGIAAIHVPESGIVDYPAVCQKLAESIQERGGAIWTDARVHTIRHGDRRVAVESEAGTVEARCVVGCAGLYSDRVAKMAGVAPEVQIVPFRGEYYALKPSARRLCRGLIYPVPDPSFPFLGVHFTRTVQGGVECGPNAVLAFAREGYDHWTVDGGEFIETLQYRGFRKLAVKYWRTAAMELWRSFSKRSFHRALQKLIPSVKMDDLVSAKAGVRAQAVTPEGRLVDDFLIKESARVINVLNAPSPAATASLNIGATVAQRVEAQLQPV